MIDKLNTLMEFWPTSHCPFPKVEREPQYWRLSVKLGHVDTVAAKSPYLLSCLQMLVVSIGQVSSTKAAHFSPLLVEIRKMIAENKATEEHSEKVVENAVAVHTERDSYVFLSNDPLLGMMTVRELIGLENEYKPGATKGMPISMRRKIGKALREQQRNR